MLEVSGSVMLSYCYVVISLNSVRIKDIYCVRDIWLEKIVLDVIATLMGYRR